MNCRSLLVAKFSQRKIRRPIMKVLVVMATVEPHPTLQVLSVGCGHDIREDDLMQLKTPNAKQGTRSCEEAE